MLSVMLATMEVSIISTALPTIVGEFQSFENFAWVGTSYIVAAAIGTPLWGKLSDLYGRRPIFLTALGVFVFGSLLCGLSQSMGQLIAFRAVQGLGGGAIQALAFAILGDILPPRERGRYIGYFTLAFVGAALLGPLLGGFIIDQFSWPWIFFVNVPLGLVAGTVAYRALRLPFSRRKAKLDWTGAAMLSIAIATLMVALEVGQDGWTDRNVITLFAISLCATAAFVVAERHAVEPIIPLRLFADGAVLSATARDVRRNNRVRRRTISPALLSGLALCVANRVWTADAAANDWRHARNVRHRSTDCAHRSLQAMADHRRSHSHRWSARRVRHFW